MALIWIFACLKFILSPPKSLYIEHEKDGQFLREMLMRLLSSAPLVQLEVILVDALSLGGHFQPGTKAFKQGQ
ncbi:hypothetical protein BTM275_02630 [Helicobacter pylori]